MPAALTPALFGKLPSTLDFVRVNHTSEVGVSYDQWTERCLQELARTGASWPNLPLRFVLPGSSGAQALVGVVLPSRDRAGRKFPVTLYAVVPSTSITPSLTSLPRGWSSFFEQAEQALADSFTLRGEELLARVASVAIPGRDQLEAAQREERAQRSPESSADAPITPTLPNSIRTQLQSILQKIRSGLEVGSAPRERAPVLDCPVAEASDVSTWFALAERHLAAARTLPWCFWSLPQAEREGRMLMGLGAPPPVVPVWFSSTRTTSERLWTLKLAQELEDHTAFESASESALEQAGEPAGSELATPHEATLAQRLWSAATQHAQPATERHSG
ncbi:MAG: type VI secretion system-associated protein TagF [Myxococcales bacterium]